MPIVFIKDIDSHTRLGLWQMDEELRMEDVCPPFVCKWLQEKCKSRQMETIATYALLRKLMCRTDLFIAHEQNGKPYLKIADIDIEKKEFNESFGHKANFNISISHTNGFASIIVSSTKNVSIDIEYRNDRVKRIANRFLREDEYIRFDEKNSINPVILNNNLSYQTLLLLHWCAKETVYKFYSDERLTFQNMRVEEIGYIKEEGIFGCENLVSNVENEIHYIQNEEIVMTYCLE